MSKALILVIEGQHAEHHSFAADLRKKDFAVELAASGGKAIERLEKGLRPSVIVINAATLRTSGKRICQSLREKGDKIPLLLILDPEREADPLDADLILTLPFTVQKLSNRINHLLPGDGKNTLHIGPIRLDIERRTVYCQKRKTRLTPRLVQLLHILMDHHGEALERRALFSQVWETNYTDDTRTLDVHISWLRRAIEENPVRPKLLKTVRGVGYRLDI